MLYKFLRKYQIQSLHLYLFHYNEVHDAVPRVYFIFYLDLEPVFGKDFFSQIFFYQNQLFLKILLFTTCILYVYYMYTICILHVYYMYTTCILYAY
jgi:hypothetical protein